MVRTNAWKAWVVMAGCAVVASCTGNSKQCSAASDCAALEPGANSSAPARATKYCEGGTCTDPPSGSSTLVVDLTFPRNTAIESIRYAVLSFKAANEEAACTGRPNCPAATATCDEIKAEGMEASRFNVALGGVKNTSTAGGVNVFQGVSLGNAPQGSQYLAIEGRSGQLGAGDRLAWACVVVSPSGGTTNQSVTLTPP